MPQGACAIEHYWLLHIGGRPGPLWDWYAEAKSTCARGLMAASLANRVGLARQVGTGLRQLPVGLGMIGIQYAPCDHDPTFACPAGGSVTDQTPSRLFFRWRPHRGSCSEACSGQNGGGIIPSCRGGGTTSGSSPEAGTQQTTLQTPLGRRCLQPGAVHQAAPCCAQGTRAYIHLSITTGTGTGPHIVCGTHGIIYKVLIGYEGAYVLGA